MLINIECQNKLKNKVNRSHHYHGNTFTYYQILHSYQLTLRILHFCINIYSPFQLHPLLEYKFFHPHFLSNVQDQLCIPDAHQIQEPFSSLAVWGEKQTNKKTYIMFSKIYMLNFKEITIQIIT